jgi:acyl-CoA reductase-like NAD-dependent aldehyde dehydrogenase
MAEIYRNYIGGRWSEAKSGATFENRNPADRRDLVGLFPDSDREDIDAAVSAAKKAQAHWRLVPAPKRGEILYRVG